MTNLRLVNAALVAVLAMPTDALSRTPATLAPPPAAKAVVETQATASGAANMGIVVKDGAASYILGTAELGGIEV